MGHATVEEWLAAGNKPQKGPDRYAVASEHSRRAPDLTPEPERPKQTHGGGFGKIKERRRAAFIAYELRR